MIKTTQIESVKAAPPVFVSLITYVEGITLEHWVLLATLAYIGLQFAYLVGKWIREASK